MKTAIGHIIVTIAAACSSACCHAQDTTLRLSNSYDPNSHKLIPDKVFEIGIPALLLFVMMNTILAVLKIRTDSRLKQQMIERGVSEETLIAIFRQGDTIAKLQPLKYALYGASLALSFIAIHLLKNVLLGQPGYLAVGIILLATSAASYAYYLVLRRKG